MLAPRAGHVESLNWSAVTTQARASGRVSVFTKFMEMKWLPSSVARPGSARTGAGAASAPFSCVVCFISVC